MFSKKNEIKTMNDNDKKVIMYFVDFILRDNEYSKLLDGLDNDWSHNFQHILRILNLSLNIYFDDNSEMKDNKVYLWEPFSDIH